MSSKFKKLLGRLLNSASRTPSPTFLESDLTEIDPEGFQLLVHGKVLARGGLAETIDHPDHGLMNVHKVGSRWMLADPESPGKDLLPVEEESLRLVRFHHKGMLRRLAQTNGMDGQTTDEGRIWTVGTRILSGLHCQVLYYPGIAELAQLYLALDSLDDTPEGTVRLVVLAGAVSLPDDYKTKLAAKRIYVDHLYRLATDDGIDLNKASLPTITSNRKPGYYFRKCGEDWEVGFNTDTPRAMMDYKAMFPIRFLLRHPGKEYSAADLVDELEGVSADSSANGSPMGRGATPVRSSGTQARGIRDLLPEARKKHGILVREKQEAKEDHGTDSQQFRIAKEAFEHFLKKNGIRNSLAGRQPKENDDFAKEAEKMRKAVERFIKKLLKTKDADLKVLSEHLKANLKCGARFSYGYGGVKMPQWHT